MFAAILLPDFRLQAALRMRDELCTQPVAIVDERSGKGVVLALNELAARSGVSAGMASPQALARCATLVLLPTAPAQERTAQAALLEVAGSLSPEVEATADGWATIDLRMAKVADWAGWGDAIVRRLAALHLQACVGVGPNPDLAYLAARRAEPVLVVRTPAAFLSHLAVAEIEPPPHLLAVLHDWGIHTLGQLTSLPRGELADRLGPEADRLWQRAAGQTQRLLRLVRPVEEFAEAFDFEQEIETVEPLLFLLRRFLDQLALRLMGAHRVAARMRLTLPLEQSSSSSSSAFTARKGEEDKEEEEEEESRAEYTRTFTIPAPTADAEVLFRILTTHLDGLQLDQRPIGVRLRIEPERPDHRQLRLFESPLRDANRFGETVARLAALVGSGNVGVAEVEDTHRPDRFRLVEPKFHELREAADSAAEEDFTVGLPLRRYRPPLLAQVRVVRYEPAYVVAEAVQGRVTGAHGPYRLSGGWWDREVWTGEEWDVEIADSGLFRLCRRGEEWFIEGAYDPAGDMPAFCPAGTTEISRWRQPPEFHPTQASVPAGTVESVTTSNVRRTPRPHAAENRGIPPERSVSDDAPLVG